MDEVGENFEAVHDSRAGTAEMSGAVYREDLPRLHRGQALEARQPGEQLRL